MPGLSQRTVLSGALATSNTTFREAAFGGDRVVYAHSDGAVEVYSTKTWKRVASYNIGKATFSPKMLCRRMGVHSSRQTLTTKWFSSEARKSCHSKRCATW